MTRGLASSSLLATYSPERQPIGADVVRQANQGLHDHARVWTALGITLPDLASRTSAVAELSAPTPAGRARRETLAAALEATENECHAIGIEMNQLYDSDAVYARDEKAPRKQWPRNRVTEYSISTFPGSRLPHAWLVHGTLPGPKVSTIDLAGKGTFSLFTGVSGLDGWRAGVEVVEREIPGLEVGVWGIGYGCEWTDVYRDWARRREVGEDGCVLVRPDRTVCWRSLGMIEGPGEKLVRVLRKVLGWT